MYISKLQLRYFRCYEQLALELPPGQSLLVGPNATGKTSLLEGILLLATTKSPRTAYDRELVQWGKAWGYAAGHFQFETGPPRAIAVALRGQESSNAEGEPPPSYLTGAKGVQVDGQVVNSVVRAIGQAPAVLFAPDDLEIIKGSPGVRRRLLNMAIAQISPRYLADLHRYRRALQQRNELLKQMAEDRVDGARLAPWTNQLVEAGVRISADREQFLSQLGPVAAELQSQLTGGAEQLEVCYSGSLAGAGDEEQREALFRQQLERGLDRELRCGATQSGPHRDDVEITANGRLLRRYGSQGQQRTAALALKLAEAYIIGQRRGELPILLLDDCFSELDNRRTCWLLELLGSFRQVLVTSAAPSDSLREADWAASYKLEGGEVKQVREVAAANE